MPRPFRFPSSAIAGGAILTLLFAVSAPVPVLEGAIVSDDPTATESLSPEVMRLLRAAEEGSLEAALDLGRYYAEGRGVPADPVEGEKWLRKAHEGGLAAAIHPLALLLLQTSNGGRLVERAAEGLAMLREAAETDPACAVSLGQLHLEGEIVAADPGEAERRFRAAADLGSAEGWHWLGRLFSGVTKSQARLNPGAASDCLETAFEKGSLEAGRLLARLLQEGTRLPKEEARAFALVAKVAESGDAEDRFRLGELYEAGIGTDRDPARAVAAYTAAAELGNTRAMDKLGRLHETGGAGVPQDEAKAQEWLARASSLGYAPADFHLALLLDRRAAAATGAEERLAVTHLLRAANAGIAEAQDHLGSWYRDGRHVIKDLLAASAWFQAAASAGSLPAKINLAQILEANLRNRDDLRKAIALYGDAASAGHPAAHFHLARFFASGIAGGVDRAKAHAHAAKAVEAGFGDATTLHEELEATLSPEERANSVTLQSSLQVFPWNPPASE